MENTIDNREAMKIQISKYPVTNETGSGKRGIIADPNSTNF